MDVNEVTQSQIDEMRALVASGDLNLTETRQMFKAKTGCATVLSDDELLKAHAALDDDDDEILVNNILALEDVKGICSFY